MLFFYFICQTWLGGIECFVNNAGFINDTFDFDTVGKLEAGIAPPLSFSGLSLL